MKCRLPNLVILLSLLFIPSRLLSADLFELRSGKTIEGNILYEDEGSYYLETSNGVSNVLRSDVVKVNGVEVSPPPLLEKKVTPSAEVPPSNSIPHRSSDNLVARVGSSGGVTQAELRPYLLIAMRDSGKASIEELTEAERRQALTHAVEDEMIFLEAVKAGVLEDSYMKWRIAETYRSRETAGRIHPELYAESELLAYYNAHPEEFMEPAKLKLKALEFYPDTPTSETNQILEKAKSDPNSVENWKDFGWVDVGYEPIKNIFDDHEAIFGMQKGAVSGIHKSSTHVLYIFWAEDRKEAEPIPFEKARGKVKFAMVNAESQDLNTKLTSGLRGQDKTGDTEEEELLFQKAVREGMHRSPDIRQAIIAHYLSMEKTTRDDILRILRERYRVQIL